MWMWVAVVVASYSRDETSISTEEFRQRKCESEKEKVRLTNLPSSLKSAS